MIAAVVLGSGAGNRMGTRVPKAFLKLQGKPMAFFAVSKMASIKGIEKIVLTVPPGWKSKAGEITGRWKIAGLMVVEGGQTRQDSVFRALQELPFDTKMVVIHDGARPLVSIELVRAVIEGAREHGACIPTLVSEESMKLVRSGRVVETLNRDEIHVVQTPQAFYYDVIMQAHRHACERKWRVTDDASLVERLGRPVAVIPGDRENIKITHPADLRLARFLMQAKK